MVVTCSPLFLTIVLVTVIVITFGIGWQWVLKTRREGAGEFDRNSMLLISLLSVALGCVVVFIFYVYFRSFIC